MIIWYVLMISIYDICVIGYMIFCIMQTCVNVSFVYCSPVLDSVTGLRWGDYLGSPSDLSEPKLIKNEMLNDGHTRVVVISTGEIVTLAAHSCLLTHETRSGGSHYQPIFKSPNCYISNHQPQQSCAPLIHCVILWEDNFTGSLVIQEYNNNNMLLILTVEKILFFKAWTYVW